MTKFEHEAGSIEVGPFLTPAVIDTVDLTRYTGEAGSRICIRSFNNAPLRCVLVSIQGETDGLMEKGLAERDPAWGGWQYQTKENLPKGQGVIIEVTAVAAPGKPATILCIGQFGERLSLECRCAGEVHRVVVSRRGN